MDGVVVVGQVGRDIVLRIPAVPAPGGSTAASDRRELLGGKGANQAVALAQLGVPVALVGVVGDDDAGTAVLAQAAADGIDVTAVCRRSGAPTALLLDLVEDGGRRRLVESVPNAVLLTEDDVARAADRIAGCRALVLQLQQPGTAVRAALERVPDGAMVVADGAPADQETRAAVLGRADVVRADTAEAAQLVGRSLDDLDDVRKAAAELLAAGPRLVCLAAGDHGNLTAWAHGEVVVPLIGGCVVDPTGGGDATVAALTAALLGGASPDDAAWTAAAAAALTVAHPGGRPHLSAGALAEVLREHRLRTPATTDEGDDVSEIDRMLEANRTWAESFAGGGRAAAPSRGVAVVACMDARLEPLELLGLTAGEAHVIRNAGGVVTEDALRSLAVSQHALGTREVLLVHHSRCGMSGLDAAAFTDQVEQATGVRPPWDPQGFADVDDDVRESIRLVRECPYLLSTEVRGTVYDVDTGQLREVR